MIKMMEDVLVKKKSQLMDILKTLQLNMSRWKDSPEAQEDPLFFYHWLSQKTKYGIDEVKLFMTILMNNELISWCEHNHPCLTEKGLEFLKEGFRMPICPSCNCQDTFAWRQIEVMVTGSTQGKSIDISRLEGGGHGIIYCYECGHILGTT